MKATQSNFPTRWSVSYHQWTSHTVFFVFSLQYAELVEKVQVTPAPPPQSQQWLASSHGCSPSLSTHLCSSCGTTESRPQTSRHPPGHFRLYLLATGTLLPHNSTLLWPQGTEHCYQQVLHLDSNFPNRPSNGLSVFIFFYSNMQSMIGFMVMIP